MIGIHPDNQAPDLKDYNVYTSAPPRAAAPASTERQNRAPKRGSKTSVKGGQSLHYPRPTQLGGKLDAPP